MTTRITGLYSGLDVDALVEAGASYYQNKVNTSKQNEQKLEWQQEQYRTIQTGVQEFYDKYLGPTGEDSLMLSSNWNTKTYASSNSAAVSATCTSDANLDNYTVSVTSLATAATGTLSTATDYSKGLEISVGGGTPIKITASEINSAVGSSDTSSSTAQKALATLINNKIGNSGASATYSELLGGIVLKTTALGGNTSLSVTDDSSSPASISLKDSSGRAATVVNGTYLNATITNSSGTSYTLGDSNAGGTTYSKTAYNSNSLTLDGVTFNFNETTSSSSTKNITSASVNNLLGNYTTGIDTTGSGYTDYIVKDSTNTGYRVRISTDGTTSLYNADGTTKVNTGSIALSDGTKINADGTVTTSDNNAVTLTGSNDVSDVQDKIESFMDDYNTLMKTINGKIYETYDKSYQPLTDSEKSSMTDAQVTKWETKAQTGLLRHDSYLEKLSSDMKSAMSSFFNNAGIDIESIGIKAVDDYTTKNGTYTVNSDTLKSALEGSITKTDGTTGKTKTITFSDIKNLFTNGNAYISSFTTKNSDTDGILSKLKVAFNVNATMSTSALAKRAGIEGTTSETTNEITLLLNDQNDQLKTLEDQLADREDALYSKYSKLETSLSSLQSSSSIFSS